MTKEQPKLSEQLRTAMDRFEYEAFDVLHEFPSMIEDAERLEADLDKARKLNRGKFAAELEIEYLKEKIKRLESQPCPFVVSSEEGTGFCRLAALPQPLDLDSEELRNFASRAMFDSIWGTSGLDYGSSAWRSTYEHLADTALQAIRDFHEKSEPTQDRLAPDYWPIIECPECMALSRPLRAQLHPPPPQEFEEVYRRMVERGSEILRPYVPVKPVKEDDQPGTRTTGNLTATLLSELGGRQGD